VLHYDLIGPGAKIENKIKDDIEKFDPSKLKKRFEERRQSVRIRQGAPAFRNKLLGAYRKCAVTGEKTRETLEAAHIVPYAGPSSNHVQNGVLLRADVHTLFDLELIGIRPEDCKIEVKPSLEKTPYFKHNGQKLKLPADPKKHPSPAALVAKWRKFKSG
jgi:putative restriction endonuclease